VERVVSARSRDGRRNDLDPARGAKRAVIGAVTDGREQDEEGVLDALVRELRGEPYRASSKPSPEGR